MQVGMLLPVTRHVTTQIFTWTAGRAFNYEPPTADMIDALGVLTQYLTVVEDPRDQAAPHKPAQVLLSLHAHIMRVRRTRDGQRRLSVHA